MKLKTDRQITLIVNNIVAACKDITKLNKTGYGFIYLASGFIAHYNLHGFIAYYQDRNLSKDILDNIHANRYLNFRPGEKDYDYMKQKADIYIAIVNILAERALEALELEDSFDRAHHNMDVS